MNQVFPPLWGPACETYSRLMTFAVARVNNKKTGKETEMEAREAFRESRLSKGVTVLLGVSVAIGLGVIGAVAAADVAGSKAPATHTLQLTSGMPDTISGHRYGGNQSIEGAVPAANANQAPDAQERNDQLAAGRTVQPHGYI